VTSSFAGITPRYVPGTGPGGRVELSDLRAKLGEIQGEAEETAESARPYATYAAVAAVVVVVVAAFVMGKRRGRRKSTWVEIRRI
jgi:pyruvate/2-oxoglutarate dehydrogenase complex dihydrolipoamide acyltransferase (E2) component